MLPSRGAANAFDRSALKYDSWYDCHHTAFESEVNALKRRIPGQGNKLEIGTGTGRFASRLGIDVGVEPSRGMATIARSRGIEVCQAYAEALPFRDGFFDVVLFVTTLCFVADPFMSLQEARRVLKPGGSVVIGMIDEDAPPGRPYATKRAQSEFYQGARFYPVEQVIAWLKELDLGEVEVSQTIFTSPDQLDRTDEVRGGHGKGLFVSICARMEGRAVSASESATE